MRTAVAPRDRPSSVQTFRIAELATVSADGERIEFRIQRRLRTPNEYLGMHWREKSRERKLWQAHLTNALMTALQVRAAMALLGPKSGVPSAGLGCQTRRRVEVVRYAPSRRNFIRDDDNLRFAVKPLNDALKHVGLIRDDHRKWLEQPSPTQALSDDGTFWTWITITDPTATSEAPDA